MLKEIRIILLGSAIILAMSAPAIAKESEGHGAGNGGDPILMRENLIRGFITNSLRETAQNYFIHFRPENIVNPNVRAILQDMVKRDVLLDIQKSPYAMTSLCLDDKGIERSGTAKNGELKGKICFNVTRLATENTSKAELIGLVIHEHAHHFGYADQDHSLFQAVYETVTLTNPSWTDGSNTRACTDVDWSSTRVGVRCKTSNNHVYERVSQKGFREAWKGPDNLIWSEVIVNPANKMNLNDPTIENDDISRFYFKYADAVHECKRLGSKLPSSEDYRRAESFGFREVLNSRFYDTPESSKPLDFPYWQKTWLKSQTYWTSTRADTQFESWVFILTPRTFFAPERSILFGGGAPGSHENDFLLTRCVTNE